MEALKQNQNKIFSLKQAKHIVIVLIVALFFEFLIFPIPSIAMEIAEAANLSQENSVNIEELSDINQGAVIIDNELNGKLPASKDAEIKWSGQTVITAYNSEIGQTDDSPCITANNFNVCEHGIEDTIAANFLPFGAKVKIPDLFGDRIFVVRDRMNRRYSNRVDVWMLERPDALNFGVKVAKIEVIK
ncbi:MAG: hypothetical protein Q8O93_01985 [bacterium]|nr:hypothetical protein [bacterium]